VTRQRIVAAALLLASIGAAGILIGFVGADRLEAFWRGSLGTGSALFSGTLVRAIPLALLGVGLSIAFKAGVFNIGGEGQLLMGGVAAVMVGLFVPAHAIIVVPLAILAAAVAGAAWAGIAGVLKSRFGVLEVISTIMLNFVAMNLVAYLVRGPLQEPTRVYPQTELIREAARLPRFGDARLHIGIFVAIAACLVGWWFLARTAAGFRLRATGASPDAARVVGRVSVARSTMLAMALSGGLAGVAGGIEVTGVTFALYENLSPGYGFAAIAVAILARLNPLAVIPSAFFFAVLETGALGMQRDAGVPSTLAAVLEAAAILIVVAFHGWRRGARGGATLHGTTA
jgi:ABC-type uncharacterized transport system permease subunit